MSSSIVIDRAIGKGDYRRYEFDGKSIVAAWPVNNMGGRKVDESAVVRPSSLKGETRKAWLAALKEFNGKSFNWESTEPVAEEKGIVITLRQASRIGNFAKPFAARVSGSDAKFRFSHSFLAAQSEVTGGEWVFRVADGIYHVCDRNSKGAKRESFIRVVNGVSEPITTEELNALYPPIEVAQSVVGVSNQLCAACGRPGSLVEDLEDGLLKHAGCCDMPIQSFGGGGSVDPRLDDFTS